MNPEEVGIGTGIALVVVVFGGIGGLAFFKRKSRRSGDHQRFVNEDQDMVEGSGGGGGGDSSTASQQEREENPSRL